MPFLKALLLRCFLPLRVFRDMRLISRRARRLASSSDGGSPSAGGFGMGGPPPLVSLTASSLNSFRAFFTLCGGPGRSLKSFLATCSASFLSRMTCAADARFRSKSCRGGAVVAAASSL